MVTRIAGRAGGQPHPRRSIVALNAGSSSLKLGVFDWETEEQLAAEAITWGDDAKVTIRGHADAARQLLSTLDPDSIGAIGHRVVHGGAHFRQAVRIDARVKRVIAELAPLAPLHNPAALAVIETAEQMLPRVPQVAVFDTAFHRTMPPSSYLYPVPYRWYEEWGIQRFGFHGLSHAYCSARAAELLKQPVAQLKLVTCHLGSGASLATVDGGRSVATTMGFTPLEGLMMGTRSGSVDPGLLLYLLSHEYLSLTDLEHTLNYESGLVGVSGISEDLREIVAATERGHQGASRAFALYTARIREGIGAMVAAMSGIDGLVFTAGVGEHSIEVRRAVCEPLGWLGVAIDEYANRIVSSDGDVATAGSRVRVLVVHTREELMVARETHQAIDQEYVEPATE